MLKESDKQKDRTMNKSIKDNTFNAKVFPSMASSEGGSSGGPRRIKRKRRGRRVEVMKRPPGWPGHHQLTCWCCLVVLLAGLALTVLGQPLDSSSPVARPVAEARVKKVFGGNEESGFFS